MNSYRSAALLPLLAVIAACAAKRHPQPQAPHQVSVKASPSPSSKKRVPSATPTETPLPPIPPSPPTPPPPVQPLEEESLAETDETPSPIMLRITPTAEVLAAVRPPAGEIHPEARPPAAGEPESLLARIGPTTPPNTAAALRLIEDARQQMRQGRYDQALDRLERAVAIDPGNAYGYYFLAQLHYHNQRYDQAIAFASRAAVLSVRSDRIWMARSYSLEGTVFEQVGRYADARKAYQQAIEADPSNAAAQNGMGRLNPQ